MAEVVTTAREAFERYEAFYAGDRLIQSNWHETASDGRQLACALGVLGDKVCDPDDCPGAIMPRWLAHMVPTFFDCQEFDDAKDWGKRFYAALDRLNGIVPFSVVHDWCASTVSVMGVDAATMRGRNTAPHVALQAMHQRALSGEKIGADEWRPILRNAAPYPYADAYTDAEAGAYASAYADADGWKRRADGMVDALNRAVAA